MPAKKSRMIVIFFCDVINVNTNPASFRFAKIDSGHIKFCREGTITGSHIVIAMIALLKSPAAKNLVCRFC
jgi:hypothetical protein